MRKVEHTEFLIWTKISQSLLGCKVFDTQIVNADLETIFLKSLFCQQTTTMKKNYAAQGPSYFTVLIVNNKGAD